MSMTRRGPGSHPSSAALVALLVTTLVQGPAVASASASPLALAAQLPVSATGPKVVVVPFGLDARARTQLGLLSHAGEEAVARSDRFVLVRAVDAFEPNRARERDEKLALADTRVREAQKALDDLDNQKALEALVEALAAYRTVDLSRSWKAYFDAWVLKAAAHATGGENPQAKQEMERLLALDARATFAPSFFPPELLKYADSQRKLVAQAKGALTVRTEPPGAPVWVDGSYRGLSPVTLSQQTGARHQVTTSLPGFALLQTELSPGEELLRFEPAELAPGFKKLADQLGKDADGEGRDLALRQLGRLLGADQVLALIAKKSLAGEQLELTVERLEVRDGHNAAFRTATVPMNDADRLTEVLDQSLARDDRRDGKAPVSHFKGGSGGSSAVRTTGFVLLGVGALAVGAGVALGVTAGQRADEFRSTAQVRVDRSTQLAQEGRTFALMADVSYGVGAVSLITGGLMALLGGSGGGSASSSEAEPPPHRETGSGSGRRIGGGSDDRKAAAERRAAEELKAQEERRAADEKRAADDRRAADEKRAADETNAKKADDERRAKEDAEGKKKSKKELQREAEEKRAQEKAEKLEAEKKAREEAQAAKKAADDARAQEKADKAEAEKKAREEAQAAKKAADDARAQEKADAEKKAHDDAQGQSGKKKSKQELQKEKDDEARAAAEKAEADRKAADEAAKKKADEDRRLKEEADKKAKEKKKDEDHDDLRNY
jgi:hypothetical protein